MASPSRCAVLALLLGLLGPGGPAAGQPAPARGHVLKAELDDTEAEGAQGRFEAALALLRGGREREAAEALLALSQDAPDDDVAPEALFEAAQIYEEQLGAPDRALDLYGELLRRYPQSRLSRRAQGRQAELAAGLRTGVRPYVELQAILRRARDPQAPERLRRLLAAYPDFVLADRVRFHLGSALLDAGRPAEARAALEELLRRQPSGEWAARALQLLGQLALQRGDYGEARARFAALGRHGGAVWGAAAAQGLEQTARARRRAWLAWTAGIYLGLLCLGLGLRARRQLLRPPFELWYYLPVGAFLVLVAGLSGGGPMLQAVLRLGLGGTLLVWLGGAAARAAGPAAGPRRALRLGAGVLLRLLGAAALCYLVAYQGGLLDLLLETLRNGPERE